MTKQIETTLFAAADKMRGKMDPGEYKYVALGLLFLRYVSAAFAAKRAELLAEEHADADEPDEYAAENVFWGPKLHAGTIWQPMPRQTISASKLITPCVRSRPATKASKTRCPRYTAAQNSRVASSLA